MSMPHARIVREHDREQPLNLLCSGERTKAFEEIKK
jgi:hypothetical protein